MKKIIYFFLLLNLIIKMEFYDDNDIKKVISYISNSKAIIIGAGAGLSTSAGFYLSGERFDKYFFDFKKKYNIQDMYSGSFYPYSKKSEYWAFMSRNIYLNRFAPMPKNTFNILYKIFKDKNYFILTTNVDHLFQKAGFDKNKIYYMQGDMGLLQCKHPCHLKNYDNYDIIKNMLLVQGFNFDEKGELFANSNIKSEISENLIPKCPKCGGEMDFNLRIGKNFVQDEGWYKHQTLYTNFIDKYKNDDILYIELCVGYNTPSIIKYNFWNKVYENKNAKFISINLEKNEVPKKIKDRSLIIMGDANEIINKIYEVINENKNKNDL